MRKMKKGFKYALVTLCLLGILVASILFFSHHSVAVLEPKGMIAKKEKELILTSSLLMLIVVIPVLLLTWIFSWKYRETNQKARFTPNWEHNSLAECCWWGVPFAIIIVLAVITWKSTHDLNPFKPLPSKKKAISIQAVALQWKWLFLYPEEGIATINFVQFPSHTPINFEITADAPMNSFWIPELSGQIYAMPAMRTTLHLIADENGTFRGGSSNLSGKGFSGMVFTAQATEDSLFQEWVEKVKQIGTPLSLRTYANLISPSSYDPVRYYRLETPDLFDQILSKYLSPPAAENR